MHTHVHPHVYGMCIACPQVLRSDLYLALPLRLSEVLAAAGGTDDALWLATTNDAGNTSDPAAAARYTAGFYLGRPRPLIRVLARLDSDAHLPCTSPASRQQLTCISAGSRRRCCGASTRTR